MSEFFDLFRRSAWRLEVQPFYGPDAEEFHRFEQGLAPTAEQRAQRQQWVDGITAATAAGQAIGRILVITPPISDYWRWRLDTATSHAAAGERIHVADAGRHPELAGLGVDFWLFDEQWAVLLDFAPDGTFLGGRDTNDPATVARCQRERGLAMAASVPLQEFLLSA